MAYLDFKLKYSTESLPAWEATNALRAITQLYYYTLIVKNAKYAAELDKIYTKDQLIPENIINRMNIDAHDILYLEAWSFSPLLSAKTSGGNVDVIKDIFNLIQIMNNIPKEPEGNCEMKRVKSIENSQKVQEIILKIIDATNMDPSTQDTAKHIIMRSLLSLKSKNIESLFASLK